MLKRKFNILDPSPPLFLSDRSCSNANADRAKRSTDAARARPVSHSSAEEERRERRSGRGMIGRGWNLTLGFRRIDLIYQVSRATSPMKIVISRRYYVTSSECSLFFFLRLFLRPSRFAFVFLSILVPGLPYIRFSPAVRLRRCRGAVHGSIECGRKLATVKYSVLHRQTRRSAIEGAIKSRVRNSGGDSSLR